MTTACRLQQNRQSHLTRGAWIEIVSSDSGSVSGECRTSHEVRGLKFIGGNLKLIAKSRTSHEVRGLKFAKERRRVDNEWSHLTRGAWIEIFTSSALDFRCWSRTSHEVRGLKSSLTAYRGGMGIRRTSHEVRGLK